MCLLNCRQANDLFLILIKGSYKCRITIELMSSLNINDIATMALKGAHYCCIIHNISKYEAIHLLENSVFEDRGFKKPILKIKSTAIILTI